MLYAVAKGKVAQTQATARRYMSVMVHARGQAWCTSPMCYVNASNCPGVQTCKQLASTCETVGALQRVRGSTMDSWAPWGIWPLLRTDSNSDPTSYPRLEYHNQDHQAADVWATACTAYGIVFGRELFPS